MEIREIAAAATGDKNFLPQPLGMFEDGYPPPTLARFDGTHQPGGAAAENQSVVFMDQFVDQEVPDRKAERLLKPLRSGADSLRPRYFPV